jgi:BirA family transcriptional regulator, biotin operon repressor / biotin---[acetyl-CoA-carboxylase] ligase
LAGPATLPAAFRLVTLESTGSTNEDAKRLARQGAPDKTLVWARSQSAGRGRNGRTWVSPPGNLYMSLVLRPDCAAARAVELGFVAAIAAGEAIDGVAGRAVPGLRFKWPNDVLVDGCKLAGILIEAESGGTGTLDWLVLGLGINVVSHPDGTEFPAIALVEAGVHGATAEALRDAFAAAFLTWSERWRAEGFGPVRAAWLARARGVGEPITVRLPNATLRGTFIDLDADGALLLGTDTGAVRRITAGDVFFG